MEINTLANNCFIFYFLLEGSFGFQVERKIGFSNYLSHICKKYIMINELDFGYIVENIEI
jgi:hypothetical protein